MSYTVDPGLYALGTPNEQTPVFVTANYKMSFDCLRKALFRRDAWLLVLDTRGINVWCAAGKGTFGTDELVRRVRLSRLEEIVNHRTLILPQLGGPGIAAHLVKKKSGFQVQYGPVRAEDLSHYLDGGHQATEAMRRKSFNVWERAVLIPVELVAALKAAIFVVPFFLLAGGLGGTTGYWQQVWSVGLFATLAWSMAIISGAVITPLLLPWIPGRAFSMKGFIVGFLTAILLALCQIDAVGTWTGRLDMLSWFFLVPAVAAYLAMNFTGASTFTSLSGVKREMKWAVPLEIGGVVIGLLFWVGARFSA